MTQKTIWFFFLVPTWLLSPRKLSQKTIYVLKYLNSEFNLPSVP